MNDTYISTEKAAMILGVPLLALGQIVADNRLTPHPGSPSLGVFSYKLSDIERLLEYNGDYIDSLK